MSKCQGIIKLCTYNNIMSRGAEGTASQQFFVNNLSTGCKLIHKVMHRVGGVGGYPQANKSPPPCVKYSPCLYNTPLQKIYAKVRMSYFVHIFLVTLVTKRK